MDQPGLRALDTSLLQNIADDGKEAKLAEWKDLACLLESMRTPDAGEAPEAIYQELEKLVAESKTVCRQKIGDAEKGEPLESATPLAEHIGRVAWIAEVKESARNLTSEDEASTDAALSDCWIRKQLQSRWKEKYDALAEERAILRVRKIHAEVTNNKEEMRKVQAEKRKLRRQLFDECTQEEMTYFLTQSQKTLDTCFDEIQQLCHLHDTQFKILLENEGLSGQAILQVLSMHENTNRQLAPKLESLAKQADALEAKLEEADRTCRKLITRIHRLCANDVDDPGVRMEEINQRLSHPHAHLYVLKALEDMKKIPRVIKPALEAIENIEEEIKSIQRTTLDAYSGLRSFA